MFTIDILDRFLDRLFTFLQSDNGLLRKAQSLPTSIPAASYNYATTKKQQGNNEDYGELLFDTSNRTLATATRGPSKFSNDNETMLLEEQAEEEDFIQFNPEFQGESYNNQSAYQRHPPHPRNFQKRHPFNESRSSSSRSEISETVFEPSRKVTIEKIPLEFCDEDQVTAYFSQFGPISYLQVLPQNQRAIIEFEEPSSAQAAFKSSEAIFGNRFVKIFLDRPNRSGSNAFQGNNYHQGHTYQNQQSRQRFSPYHTRSTYNMTAYGFEHHPRSLSAQLYNQQPTIPSKATERQQRLTHLLELQKKKEIFLQKQIEEQKLLLEKLSSPELSESTKLELMSALKSIQKSIEDLNNVASPKDTLSSPSQANTAMTNSVTPKQPQLSYSSGFRAQTNNASYNLYKSTDAPKAFKIDNMKKITITPVPDMFKENQGQFIKFFKAISPFHPYKDPYIF